MGSLQTVRIGPIMATLQAKTVVVRAITTMPEGLHGAAGITAAAAVTTEVVGLAAPRLHREAAGVAAAVALAEVAEATHRQAAHIEAETSQSTSQR